MSAPEPDRTAALAQSLLAPGHSGPLLDDARTVARAYLALVAERDRLREWATTARQIIDADVRLQHSLGQTETATSLRDFSASFPAVAPPPPPPPQET